MGATSELHRRNNESHDASPYRVSVRLAAAKGLLATLKPGGIQKKGFEETRASLVTKQCLNLEYPSLQDFEILQTLGMVCWNKTSCFAPQSLQTCLILSNKAPCRHWDIWQSQAGQKPFHRNLSGTEGSEESKGFGAQASVTYCQ